MTAAIGSAAAGGIGGIFSALGGITSGESGALSATAQGEAAAYSAQVARNNAIISGYNATNAEEAGGVQAQAVSMAGAQNIAKIKTATAASNVDVNTGSAKNVQVGAREVNQLNTETVLNNANLQAYGYRMAAFSSTEQAGLETLAASEAPTEASLAEEGGAESAGAGILGAASNIGFKFAGLSQPTGTGGQTTGVTG